jgi:hypothetical protein
MPVRVNCPGHELEAIGKLSECFIVCRFLCGGGQIPQDWADPVIV